MEPSLLALVGGNCLEETKTPPSPGRKGGSWRPLPFPTMKTRTHLDATPGKLWVLLLKLGDELVIMYLQQTQAVTLCWGLLQAGRGHLTLPCPGTSDTHWGHKNQHWQVSVWPQSLREQMGGRGWG